MPITLPLKITVTKSSLQLGAESTALDRMQTEKQHADRENDRLIQGQ